MGMEWEMMDEGWIDAVVVWWPFMDLFHLWWRCDPKWRGGELPFLPSTWGVSSFLHFMPLWVSLASKLIPSPSLDSNSFELFLIFSWDLVLLHLCTASFEIGEFA